MHKIAASGFTLAEMLITITILGILAAAAIPLLSANDPQKLSVAAEETANTLRFALREAKRSGGYVLVDGETTSGQLKFYTSNASATVGAAVVDPLTKRAMILNMNSSVFSAGVILSPQFNSTGGPDAGILIGPGLSQIQTIKNGSPVSALQANSGVLLSYGAQSVTVNINEITGLVTLP